MNALQTGGQVVIKPNKSQSGGLIGSILASIGIPIAIEMASKLFGKGLSVPKKAGGLRVSPKPGLMPYYPPPFIGSGGKKKSQRKRITSRKEFSLQRNSTFRDNPLKPNEVSGEAPPFKDIPLSNFGFKELG